MAEVTAEQKDAAKKTETKVATPAEATPVKMADLTTIKMTQKEFDALDAAALRAKLCSEPQSRISRERGKTYLVDNVASGKINSITAAVLMNWTFRGVVVKGVEFKGQGRSAENALKTLTQAEFDKLSPTETSALINEYTHKRRAADVIIPALVTVGMPLTAEDVVYLTNGRIEVEGVTVTKSSKTTEAVVTGVTFA